jgi:hypothetical protein
MAVKLNTWKMTEQKLLREPDWTLDQLDQVERDKRVASQWQSDQKSGDGKGLRRPKTTISLNWSRF